MRLLLWIIGGLALGVIIHIVVILSLPTLSPTGAWDRIAALGALDRPQVLPPVTAGQPNPLRLDPDLSYAVCQIDLRKGPGTVVGTLPQAFWSVAVYGRGGTVLYSTTNRDGIGQTLELGLFNERQTQLLAQQKLDVSDGLLIVETKQDDLFVVIRVAAPHEAMRERYAAELAAVTCGNIAS